MQTMNFRLLPLAVAAMLASTGCSTYTQSKAVEAKVEAIVRQADEQTSRAASRTRPTQESIAQAADVSTPWLAGKSVPLAKEVSLPYALRRMVKVSELDRNCVSSLTSISICLSRDLGIAFRVTPDALLPIGNFTQRRSTLAGAQQAQVVQAPLPVQVQAANAAPGGRGAAINNSPNAFPIPISDIPLPKLMDLIGSHYGVNYRVTDSGEVQFFRLQTRVLHLRALAQKISNTVTVNTGFESQSKTTYENTAQETLKNMQVALLSLGTSAGDLTINPESKSVIVTDTPEAIARIESYLDAENKRLTRRITILMEEIIVTNSRLNEAGIDWNLVYNQATTALNAQNTLLSSGSLASANAAKGGIALSGFGKLAGSSVVVNALNQLGLTSTTRSFPVSTMNGSPVSIGIPTIFDYVSQVSTSTVTSGIGTVSAPSVQQKEEKIGAFFNVTPESQEDGTIMLSYTLQDRSGTLTPYTVSVNGTGTTIQQRNIQEVSLAQRTVLRVGIPHLVGGLDERSDNSSSRRLDENAPILAGGSDSIRQNTRRVLLLVTAFAEEGV